MNGNVTSLEECIRSILEECEGEVNEAKRRFELACSNHWVSESNYWSGRLEQAEYMLLFVRYQLREI